MSSVNANSVNKTHFSEQKDDKKPSYDIKQRLWQNRHKIMMASCLVYGVFDRAIHKNYSLKASSTDGVLAFTPATHIEKLKAGLFFDHNHFQGKILLSDIIGATLASLYPAVTVTSFIGAKISNKLCNYFNDARISKMRSLFNAPPIVKDGNILKCADQALAQYMTIGTDKGQKPLTIFLNHGVGGHFKEMTHAIGTPQLSMLAQKIKKQNPDRLINLVSVRQNSWQAPIIDKLMDYFDQSKSDYRVFGYSAGSISAIKQTKQLHNHGKNVEKIVLKAPVFDIIPMPASVKWLLKPIENLVFSSGLMSKLPLGNKETWHGTLSPSLKIPKPLEDKTTIMQHKKDLAVYTSYFNQFERLINHVPNAKVIIETMPIIANEQFYDQKAAGHVHIMANAESLDKTISELLNK